MVSRYAIIQNGVCTNVVRWDGDTTKWTPPAGAQVVPFDPAVHVVAVPVEVTNRQAIADALATAITYFGGNYTNWSTLTSAQKDTTAKNGQRALAQISRWLLGQFDSAG